MTKVIIIGEAHNGHSHLAASLEEKRLKDSGVVVVAAEELKNNLAKEVSSDLEVLARVNASECVNDFINPKIQEPDLPEVDLFSIEQNRLRKRYQKRH